MPLPTNATVAIQGQPTTMQMLKRAFIVRLSDDALEAFEDLQNPPKVEVDFNEDGPVSTQYPMAPDTSSLLRNGGLLLVEKV